MDACQDYIDYCSRLGVNCRAGTSGAAARKLSPVSSKLPVPGAWFSSANVPWLCLLPLKCLLNSDAHLTCVWCRLCQRNCTHTRLQPPTSNRYVRNDALRVELAYFAPRPSCQATILPDRAKAWKLRLPFIMRLLQGAAWCDRLALQQLLDEDDNVIWSAGSSTSGFDFPNTQSKSNVFGSVPAFGTSFGTSLGGAFGAGSPVLSTGFGAKSVPSSGGFTFTHQPFPVPTANDVADTNGDADEEPDAQPQEPQASCQAIQLCLESSHES